VSDETTQPDETPDEQPAVEAQPLTPEAEAVVEEVAEELVAEAVAEEIVAEAEAEAVAEVLAEEIVAEAIAEEIVTEAVAEEIAEELEVEEIEEAPRVKPAIPGMDLEVDIVVEGQDPLARGEGEEGEDGEDEDTISDEPIVSTIDLAADARYRATGKRKTAVARVTLKPGTGVYTINGRAFDDAFPRETLRKNIIQPLEAVGFAERMDVVAALHGGGVSAQAGALRHGISRALLEADPNLRGELKRRGFLTRDARAKERKKAGLKKARKRPQFSKR
jgi:small subunit ribosomal protein S9